MKVAVIIPAYNEAANLPRIIREIRDLNIASLIAVVVNDGSTDRTREVALELGVSLVDLPFNLGIGGAVQTGIKWAIANGCTHGLQLDGDGQHAPTDIKFFFEKAAATHSDLIIGSRFLSKKNRGFQSTRLRRIGINWFRMLLGMLTRTKVSDPTSGYRLMSRRLLMEFSSSYPSDYPEPESLGFALAAGYSYAEIDVQMRSREAGLSSISSWRTVYYMIKVSLGIILGVIKGSAERRQRV